LAISRYRLADLFRDTLLNVLDTQDVFITYVLKAAHVNRGFNALLETETACTRKYKPFPLEKKLWTAAD
jgi:hypothetical protein